MTNSPKPLDLDGAVGVLNERKWRERDDWFVWEPTANEEVVSRSMHDGSESFDAIYAKDAIAIATGLLAQERIGELERELAAAKRIGNAGVKDMSTFADSLIEGNRILTSQLADLTARYDALQRDYNEADQLLGRGKHDAHTLSYRVQRLKDRCDALQSWQQRVREPRKPYSEQAAQAIAALEERYADEDVELVSIEHLIREIDRADALAAERDRLAGQLAAEVQYLEQRQHENERRAATHYGPDASWYNAKADTYSRAAARLELIAALAALLAEGEE